VHQTGANLACATGGCETVQSSRYAELFGVPVAALGLVAFLSLLGAAVVGGDRGRGAQLLIALTGVVLGAYLLYVQLHVIGAVCEWCVASDAVMGTVAGLALLRLRVAAAETPRYRSSRRPCSSA
jgi:uncharacterized membrane protein